MIKTVICYNVPGVVVVFDNRVVCVSVYYILFFIFNYTFFFYADICSMRL